VGPDEDGALFASAQRRRGVPEHRGVAAGARAPPPLFRGEEGGRGEKKGQAGLGKGVFGSTMSS